jgi:hypothetical protein
MISNAGKAVIPQSEDERTGLSRRKRRYRRALSPQATGRFIGDLLWLATIAFVFAILTGIVH